MNRGELLILVLVLAADLTLGSIVLARNNRSWSNRLFALTALAMVAWLVSNFMCDQPLFYADALQLNRLSVALGAVMGIPLLAFTLTFPIGHPGSYRRGLVPERTRTQGVAT